VGARNYMSRGVINWSTGGSTPLTPTVDFRTYVVVGMMTDVGAPAQSGRCRSTALARRRLAAGDGAEGSTTALAPFYLSLVIGLYILRL